MGTAPNIDTAIESSSNTGTATYIYNVTDTANWSCTTTIISTSESASLFLWFAICSARIHRDFYGISKIGHTASFVGETCSEGKCEVLSNISWDPKFTIHIIGSSRS